MYTIKTFIFSAQSDMVQLFVAVWRKTATLDTQIFWGCQICYAVVMGISSGQAVSNIPANVLFATARWHFHPIGMNSMAMNIIITDVTKAIFSNTNYTKDRAFILLVWYIENLATVDPCINCFIFMRKIK